MLLLRLLQLLRLLHGTPLPALPLSLLLPPLRKLLHERCARRCLLPRFLRIGCRHFLCPLLDLRLPLLDPRLPLLELLLPLPELLLPLLELAHVRGGVLLQLLRNAWRRIIPL